MGYDYKKMLEELKALKRSYPFVDIFSVGESVMEKKLYCVSVGRGKRKIFVNAAHHGLEYLTAAFLMRFLLRLCECYADGERLLGYDVEALYESVTLYAVPMVNPDGVDIAVNGIDITNPYHRRLISLVGIHSFNKVWQANVNGVDINHNYNAGWRAVTEYPSPSKYSGPCCESEPETKAIVEFVRSMGFDMLIAFHSQGGEIYYDFDGRTPPGAPELADRLAAVSGYEPKHTIGSAAFGGCKDWCIKEFGTCGFTIEMGRGKNPLPETMLDELFDENAKIILCAMAEIESRLEEAHR